MHTLEIQDLKKGMVIYECQYGQNIKMTIKDDPKDEGDSFSAIGITDGGKEIFLLASKHPGFAHYGPRLYNEPQYGTRKE